MATPDGRLSGTTYSDGSVSAYAGTDKNGVYALFESATIWDQAVVQNSQMNLKLHPTTIKDNKELKIIRFNKKLFKKRWVPYSI